MKKQRLNTWFYFNEKAEKNNEHHVYLFEKRLAKQSSFLLNEQSTKNTTIKHFN